MIAKDNQYRIVPVRFPLDDLKRLEAEAAALRLPIAALVRAKIARLLEGDKNVVQV